MRWPALDGQRVHRTDTCCASAACAPLWLGTPREPALVHVLLLSVAAAQTGTVACPGRCSGMRSGSVMVVVVAEGWQGWCGESQLPSAYTDTKTSLPQAGTRQTFVIFPCLWATQARTAAACMAARCGGRHQGTAHHGF